MAERLSRVAVNVITESVVPVISKRVILSAVLCLIGCATGYVARPLADPFESRQPMPAPTDPVSLRPDAAGVLKLTKIEIVDPAGKLVLILTSEDGKPIIVVRDGNGSRKVDLAWLARRVG